MAFSSSAGGIWGLTGSSQTQADWTAVAGPAFIKHKPTILTSNGVTTIIGPQGPQGPSGLMGPQGVQGLQGIQGVSPDPESVKDEVLKEVASLAISTATDIAKSALEPYITQIKTAITDAVKSVTSGYAMLQEEEVAIAEEIAATTAAEEAAVTADTAAALADTAAATADAAAVLDGTAAAADAAVGAAVAEEGAALAVGGTPAESKAAAEAAAAAAQAANASKTENAVSTAANLAEGGADTAGQLANDAAQGEATEAKAGADVGKDIADGAGDLVKDGADVLKDLFGGSDTPDDATGSADLQDPTDPTDDSGFGDGTDGPVSAIPQPDWNATGVWPANGTILNKPVIPDAQIQSDWNQILPNFPDFIKNKPVIGGNQIQSDWNATTGIGAILNKPSISDIGSTTVVNNSAQVNGDLVVTGNIMVQGNATMSAQNATATTGYVSLPGGFVMNFGSFTYTPTTFNTSVFVPFLKPFANTCMSVTVTPGDPPLNLVQSPVVSVYDVVSTSFNVAIGNSSNFSGTSLPLTGYYQAIGT